MDQLFEIFWRLLLLSLLVEDEVLSSDDVALAFSFQYLTNSGTFTMPFESTIGIVPIATRSGLAPLLTAVWWIQQVVDT